MNLSLSLPTRFEGRYRFAYLFKVELSGVQSEKERKGPQSAGPVSSRVESSRWDTYVGRGLVLVDACALVRQGEATLVLARLLCDRLWGSKGDFQSADLGDGGARSVKGRGPGRFWQTLSCP